GGGEDAADERGAARRSGGNPEAGLAKDHETGEAARGLGWLMGGARAFLGAAPAREGVESESEGESLLQSARGVGDASPGATTAFGRLREKVEERTPGKRTMSDYGDLGLTAEPLSTSPGPAFFYDALSQKARLSRPQSA